MAAINKLSDTQLRSISGKSYTGKSVLSDGAGLAVRISKNGVIGWIYRYRLGGRYTKLQWIGLGKYPETSIKQARAKRDKCRAWLDEGKDPNIQLAIAQAKQQTPVTVKEALDYWLSEYAIEKRKNYDKNKAQFEKHIYPYIGKLPVEQVSKSQWFTCFDRIKKGIPNKQHPAPVAAGQVLQSAKQALLFCRKREYAITHVLDDISIPDVGAKANRRDRVLSNSELQDVLNYVYSKQGQAYYRHLIWLLIVFGARSQEIRLSTWNEWDFEKNIWTVPKANSKTSELILRPIPSKLKAWLMDLKSKTHQSSYLLGEVKNAPAVSAFGGNLWKKFKHTEKWTLHDLRRTLATRLNDLGIQPHIVEHQLGHTVGGVSGIYNRADYINEKRKALDLWLSTIDTQENC